MSKEIYTKEVLQEAVEKSSCFSDVCKLLGVRGGSSWQHVKNKIERYEIDVSHFGSAKSRGILKAGISKKKTWQQVLVDGYSQRLGSKQIRRALMESGRNYTCEICGLGPEWNGQELTLQVDHIDGNWKDCRKENLRFACPNCHTQQPTFCNQGKSKRCKNCHKKITSRATYCLRCFGLFGKRNHNYKNNCNRNCNYKVHPDNRPSMEVLMSEIESLGYLGTGRKYGVSDNAVRKWIKRNNRELGTGLLTVLP